MKRLALLATLAIGVPAFVACGKTKGAKLTREECDALRAAAMTSADKAAPSPGPGDPPACYSREDCVDLPRPSCVGQCGAYAAPKGARDGVAKSLRAVEDGPCKRWNDENCGAISPMPIASCGSYVPACKEGRCIMRNAHEILSAAECESLLASSQRELDAKVAAADRDCKKDDDCTLTLGGCVSSCGGPAVAKRGEAAFKAEYASVAATCKKWWDGDCMTTTPQPIPSCAPVAARCTGGKCNAVVGFPQPTQ